MSDTNLALLLLGAFWTGTSAVFTGMKNAGEVRDRIFVATLGEQKLSDDYLRGLLWLEWLPLKLSLAAISAVLAIIILALPSLSTSPTSPTSDFKRICVVAAAVPLTGCFFFLITGLLEWRFLTKSLQARRRAQSPAPAVPTP